MLLGLVDLDLSLAEEHRVDRQDCRKETPMHINVLYLQIFSSCVRQHRFSDLFACHWSKYLRVVNASAQR